MTLRSGSVTVLAAIAVFCVVYVPPALKLNNFSSAALGQEAALPQSAVSPDFASLVTPVHAGLTRVNKAEQHVKLEGIQEMNKNEVRQLQIANDNLQSAEAQLDEGNKLVKQRYIEVLATKAEVEKYTLEATTGKSVDAKNAAVQDTAGLSAQKKLYLDARDLYADSTKLVAQYKVELKGSKAASAIAFAAYNAKKTAADEATVAADKQAVAKENFQKSTSAEAEVGEEATSDAVARAQQMAEVSAKAVHAEIEAHSLMQQASDLKAVWESKLALQKTAQETLDAELKRNAELSIKSTRAQKDFIDSTHVAAVEATGSADYQQKTKQLLDNASAAQAAAETSLEATQKEAHRLSRIVDVRRVELDSQKAKSEATQAALDLQTALYEVAQTQMEVELDKEHGNHDATIATLQANFDDKKLKAANAKKTADQIKADAQADGIRLEAISVADNRVHVKPVTTEGAAAVSRLGLNVNPAVGNGASDVISRPKEKYDPSKIASIGSAPDPAYRFLTRFNFLMMGDGTDKSIVMSMCNRMLQPEQRIAEWASSFPMHTEEFPRNMRPFICEEGFGESSRCSLAPEHSCCADGKCCMDSYSGNAAMHCANPSGSHTHVGLAHHFGLSEDATPVFDADVVRESQGFDLPFSTGARLEAAFGSFTDMLAADADALKKPLIVTLQSMLWDVYRFSLGQVQPERCPGCDKTPESLFETFEEKLTALTVRVQTFTKAKYPGPACLVLRTQFATHPAPAFGVPDWLPKMNSIIIKVGKQLNVPVFRYDEAIEAYNRLGNKWMDIFVKGTGAEGEDMLYHPAPATSEMIMADFVQRVEQGLCDRA